MAQKPAFLKFFTDPKNRTTVIFVGIIFAALSILAYVFLFSSSGTDTIPSRTAQIPKNIDVTPGADLPERYRNLQVEENIRRADEAKKAGSSSIPTLVGGLKKYDFDLPKFENKPEESGFGELDPEEQFKLQAEKRDKKKDPQSDLQSKRDSAIVEQERRRRDRQENIRLQRQRKDSDRSLEKHVGLMEGQMKAMFQTWNNYAKQDYVAGDSDSTTESGGASEAVGAGTSTAPGSSSVADEGNTIKAGSVMFAVLDTAINTDETGPILATLVQGPYKGAKLVGSVTFNPGFKRVILQFSLMSIPQLTNSVAISSVAIDPDTARTAFASDVDNHYLQRYGALFAASFLEGYGDAISNQGTSVTTTSGSTTTSQPDLSGSEEFYAALGNVGKALGQQLDPIFQRPPTVTVDQGTGFGLLFTEDVIVPYE